LLATAIACFTFSVTTTGLAQRKVDIRFVDDNSKPMFSTKMHPPGNRGSKKRSLLHSREVRQRCCLDRSDREHAFLEPEPPARCIEIEK